MEVITTHVNADFDCLGAMVAAKKLYPEALMVFAGSQEKSMRDFFLKSTEYLLNFTRLKDLDLSLITRLIIVDCQHTSRIGKFTEIIHRPGLDIHIYDHHPESFGDIPRTGGEVRACGSSTTILSRLLIKQGIEVTPTEATLMMLGIYEDTGSLTFPSTTTEDYYAAAWLLEQGAHLNTVADFITQELTAEQVSLLNDLLKSLRTVNYNGVEISVANASVDYYIGDIAVLAHMMRDMENLEALFLLVEMGNRVYVVARSRIPEVDAGEIMREFDGGGHASAASATVRGLTLIQVQDRLYRVLGQKVNPKRIARDLMSSPAKTMNYSTAIAEARELLTRYNVNAMPVMNSETMVGIISRRIVEKALYHGLGELPVSEYMHTEYMTATPQTPINAIQEYIVGQNRRLVPVFEGNVLIGVITRTDLLRYMYAGLNVSEDSLFDLAEENIPVRRKEVERLMTRYLSSEVLRILRDIGEIGDQLELSVYAVGGFVRDLSLGIDNDDIDVTVEGDGILFAETFARQHNCRVKSHQKFGTAVIIFPDGFKIDVASTRLEYYATPGALPTVERSSLKMDLYRRDFTINTLAIRLNTIDFGVLIDYFGAYRDLHDRSIRVLHNLSFVEDPTRVFRAVRFEQRLGFRIASHTENLIKNAVKMGFLEKLGGKRLLTELIYILREKEPVRAVVRMDQLGLLQFIHPDLRLLPGNLHVLDEAKKIVSWFELLFLGKEYERWVVYFLALCSDLKDDQLWGAATRLSASELYRAKISKVRREGERTLEYLERCVSSRKSVARSDIYFLLKDLDVELLLYLMARTSRAEVKKYISLYVTQLQEITCLMDGNDLKALGLRPGPLFRELFEKVLAARIDGRVVTREDEVQLVKDELGQVL